MCKLLQAGYGRRLIKLIQSLCVCVCVQELLPPDTRLLLGPTQITSLVSRHSSITALFTSSHSPTEETQTERERERGREREGERYIHTGGEEQEQQQQSSSVERTQLRICRGQGALFGASQLPAVFRQVGFLLLRFSVVS
jgi:hypothetical protein